MKKLLFTILLGTTLFACKKEAPAVTVPVKFTATTYQTLGLFDVSGKPGYLETSDVVSDSLLSFLHTTLPERTNLSTTHPEMLLTSAIGDVPITQRTTLHVTFVSQGTMYTDALGFYTYPTNSPPATATDIKVITYIFPNAGGGTTLHAGDKVNIGTFDAGTSVGFVLMKNAWNAATQVIDNGAVHFCSNDVLNPEVNTGLKKHAVLLSYPKENKTLLGFEDIDRTEPSCDNDFNDVVVYISKDLH
ncbi:MAG: DUF4114 domain-containing protein [Mucilaginibacter sp.]